MFVDGGRRLTRVLFTTNSNVLRRSHAASGERHSDRLEGRPKKHWRSKDTSTTSILARTRIASVDQLTSPDTRGKQVCV